MGKLYNSRANYNQYHKVQKLFSANIFGIIALLILTFNSFSQCYTTVSTGSLRAFQCNSPTDINPFNTGRYERFNVQAGIVYNFNTCSAGFDTRLYGRNGSTTGTVVFNVDDTRNAGNCTTGLREDYDWNASFTGVLFVSTAPFNCTWTGTSAVLTYKQVSTVNNTTSTASIYLCQTKELTASVTHGISVNTTATPTWSIVSGGGSISGTTYTPSTTGIKVLRATLGVCTSDVTFNVTGNISISGTLSACVGGTSDLTTAEPDWSGLPTGGTVTTIGTERVHRFTTSGTFNTPQAISGARVLVIGGGGSGGTNGGGGGGAGGVYENNSYSIISGGTTVTVGAPGALHSNTATAPTPGGQSAFGAITAGGGGGGASRDNGVNGGGPGGTGTVNGSGGGGGGSESAALRAAGIGIFNGGVGFGGACNSAGGGGGGAGAAGGNAGSNLGGAGGTGIQSDITGTSLWYAGGGGGGLTGFVGCGGNGSWTGTNGTGGSGVGGNGESTVGAANTGSGGGAERAGASGVVIVRYGAPNWSSSNPAIATVNPLTGLVTAVSAGTTTITYTSPDGCTDSETFTVYAPGVSPTGITGIGTYCHGNAVTLTQTGGSGSIEWFTGSCGGTSAGTGNSITVSPTTTTTYYVRAAANGSCPATACFNGAVTLPSQAGPLGNNGDMATCAVSENNWVHFYHSSGRLLASINSGGQNLGNVTVTSYVDGAPSLVDACDEPGNVGYQTSHMQRHWVITPSIQPINPVQVRLPFTDTELGNLSGASILNSNPNDNVAIIGDVLLSKYSGPNNVDNNAPNNCIALGGNEGTTLHGQTANGVVTSYAPAIGASQYIDYTIPGFSEFWLHGSSNNSPLPVELTSFTADCQEDGRVELKWVTASEHNSSYFMVEKSSDALSWEDLVMVAAAGNTSSISYYKTIDENSRGINYYRLIQVDNNGESKVYDALASNCNVDKIGMNLFPNPASSVVTLELNENIDAENVYVGFYDVHGKMIKRVDINQNNGKYIYVDVKDLSSGYYIVRLFDGQSEKQPIRFVKQ